LVRGRRATLAIALTIFQLTTAYIKHKNEQQTINIPFQSNENPGIRAEKRFNEGKR
jgi:hypothetical protein